MRYIYENTPKELENPLPSLSSLRLPPLFRGVVVDPSPPYTPPPPPGNSLAPSRPRPPSPSPSAAGRGSVGRAFAVWSRRRYRRAFLLQHGMRVLSAVSFLRA
ncbi:hypothetical protein ZWY2020_029873 [Hordeum vulgare]|nr:hypothetical protein ZWY2020_029873 [Hordeum vulgare]